MNEDAFRSWGGYPVASSQLVRYHDWPDNALPDSRYLPRGLGRSYGDACLISGGTLLITTAMNRLVNFDSEQGLLTAEAGISLGEILEVTVPRGWFLPVLPGTRYVTLGGAIANDVHGKNHHQAGTFGCHVRRIEVKRSDGAILCCSPAENNELFCATVGGIGLTGVILRATVKLRRIVTPYLDTESIKFTGLDQFFALSAESAGYEFVVAWIDCLSRGAQFARGIFMRGAFSAESDPRALRESVGGPRLAIPFYLPEWVLNRGTLKIFNAAYYHRSPARMRRERSHFAPYFFPLDAVRGWNRIYGRRGLVQFQCVVPQAGARAAIEEMLRVCSAAGEGSFLAVLKEFGPAHSPGLLSFPMPGATLALDFPFRGERTLKLLAALEQLAAEAGGRLYAAKDSCMTREHFNRFYPAADQLRRWIDPAISSDFARRVGLLEK